MKRLVFVAFILVAYSQIPPAYDIGAIIDPVPLLEPAKTSTILTTNSNGTNFGVPDNKGEYTPILLSPNSIPTPIPSDFVSTQPSNIMAIGTMPPLPIFSSQYQLTNNFWNASVAAGGGCFNNRGKICGVAIRPIGSLHDYITNYFNSYLKLQPKINNQLGDNQIFTLTQNFDCTWSIQNQGKYLSTVNNNNGNWVSFSSSIGYAQRWYLQRGSLKVFIQSAVHKLKYWQFDSNDIVRYGSSRSTLTFQIYPCDKTIGWNN